MTVIVALFTGAVYVGSVVTSPTYDARADLLLVRDDDGLSGGADAESSRRELATLRTLVTTPSVLQPAATRLGVGVGDLRRRVASSVDAEANILSIAASAGTARGARDIANAVATSFVEQRGRAERARLGAIISTLSRQIAALRADTDGADATVAQLTALEERRAQLVVAQASAGTSLQVAQAAELPADPSSPRPLRNAVLAFFAALLLATLVALARDAVRPAARA
jgi:capsular polysaccharide biosynthesis protein